MTDKLTVDSEEQAVALTSSAPLIYVVDDDEDVVESIAQLLSSHDLSVQSFTYPEQFLANISLDRPGCIILDLMMPELNGLEVLSQLAARGIGIPVILLSGYGTIAKAVEAMHMGALDFLEKPCPGQILIDSVNSALKADGIRREQNRKTDDSRKRIERLTRREREVFILVAQGKSNRDIGGLLEISTRTVETHRKRLMKKMVIRGFDELLSLAKDLQLN